MSDDLRTYWVLDSDGEAHTTVASCRADARLNIERNLPGTRIAEIEELTR